MMEIPEQECRQPTRRIFFSLAKYWKTLNILLL
jgi:hypothetical protein